MPFPKWAVEPVFLSRHNVPPDKSEPGNFCPVTQATLVGCLRQLASVVKIADQIFYEIGTEVRLLAEKSERIKAKVASCEEVVSKLNARAVKVPRCDLDTASRLQRSRAPFRTQYEASSQLFLPATRPACVDALYGAAGASPAALLSGIRCEGGLSASDLFMVTPVLGRGKTKKRPLDVETWKPSNFSLERSPQDRIESGSTSLPVSPSRGYILKQNENLELERLPSPEEQAMLMSLEYPSTLVPVDTSGTSFNRMSLLRRSLIHADFVIKRKKSGKKRSKRRHTICEGTIRQVTDTSCQTEDMLSLASSSLPRRRSRSLHDPIDDDRKEDEEKKSPSKSTASPSKKSKGWYSSLSAALSSVKLRGSGVGRKADDGRSSSGNWSASSSTRASVDDSASPSRNSLGKDSLLSEAHDNRSRDDILHIQSLTCSPVKKKKFPPGWGERATPTPDLRSPFAGRRLHQRPLPTDDGDSSVYSVDTDGYYTSMHTDSGLWRREDDPTVVEDDEESVNSFLSSAATATQRGGSTSESDVDARDRILQKTAITRYPSMCAVSPETSDDDSSDGKRRTVVLAEVHSAPVNMFRSETPVPSSFSAALENQTTLRRTSTPRTSTFSPDVNDNRKTFDVNMNSDGVVVTEKPASPLLQATDKSLIPLKYAQRITVTPISRPDSNTGTVKRTPLKPLSSNDVKPSLLSSAKQETSPSYVSFKAPDSPVSVSSSFKLGGTDSKVSSPTNSLTRPVARVTLDPTGKVVYSSNSLERPGNVSPSKNNLENRAYSTIPKYQTSVNRSPVSVQNGSSRDQSNVNLSSFSIRDAQKSRDQIDSNKNPLYGRGTTVCDSRPSTADLKNQTLEQSNANRSVTPIKDLQNKIPVHINRSFTPIRENNSAVDNRSSIPIKEVQYGTSLSQNINRSSTPSREQERTSVDNANRSAREGHYYSSKPSVDSPGAEVPSYNNYSSMRSGKDFTFRPSRGGRFCRSYFPSHLISNPSPQPAATPSPSSSPVMPRDSAGQSQSSVQSSPKSTPVPNSPTKFSTPQSRIWPSRLQQQSVVVASKPTQYLDRTLSPPDLIPAGESPPSTLDITSSANTRRREPPSTPEKNLRSLSANELFAIIHSSKRKLNIKTEAERSSSPMSSRSASPALSQGRGGVETGSLDRRGTPTPSAPRSPATKPTSLRDFKLLLLQSRVDGGVPRPSAAELLKVSPPRASPTPRAVPVRRSARTRSPYAARYDSAYPPIIEDCSEEDASSDRSQSSSGGPQFVQKPTPAKATSTWV